MTKNKVSRFLFLVSRNFEEVSHSRKAHGELEEIRFLLEAASHGLEVARPWGDSLPYDFLVGRRGRFYRVQVKSSRYRRYRAYQVITTHRRDARGYSTRELDFLAAYVVPTKTWYVIPARALRRRRAIYLYPKQRPAVGTGLYEKYREAWKRLRA